MPLFSFHCRQCDKTSEILILGSEKPECPSCGNKKLDKQLARVAAPGRSKAIIGSMRKQAAREGHFSNYSKSERAKTKT